jgi:D-tagatose-1,6-bisphosphate aldolase subunit GatZ/KbaZ
MTEHVLDTVVRAQRGGVAQGVTSICSAHPVVLETAVEHAVAGEHILLVEATCNQVNQEGGYTGMVPSDFRREVESLAGRVGLPAERLVLGGDHLGPNPWKSLPAAEAMKRSEVLVQAYVAAGFSKIHLDASMACLDDPSPLPPAIIADRTARLAAIAEGVAEHPLRYVIGTEVPVPGGESAGEHGIHVTRTEDVTETIELTRKAFENAGVAAAWERVRAVVAQPGVEFSDRELFRYVPGQAAHLAGCLDGTDLVFEAHSTDYQTREALRGLVTDQFAILKVGPGLTNAYREAVFALSFIEDEIRGAAASHVRDVLDAVMLENPSYWQPFYSSDPQQAAFARKYSRSDRSRYYWPQPAVEQAVAQMVSGLQNIPDELLSQFLPAQARLVAQGELVAEPRTLMRDKVREVLDDYAAAVTP